MFSLIALAVSYRRQLAADAAVRPVAAVRADIVQDNVKLPLAA